MSSESTVIITGVSSGIGRMLASRLAGTHRVLGLTRDKAGLPSMVAGVEYVEADLGRSPRFDGITAAGCIIHAAAETPGRHDDKSPEKIRRFEGINVEGTRAVLGLARRIGARRFLFVSSHAAIRAARVGASLEPYGDSKLRAEDLVRRSGLEWTILRPTGVYSPTEYFKRHLESLKAKRLVLIRGNGSTLVQQVYVGDVVSALLACIGNRKTIGQCYSLAGRDSITLRQYHDLVGDLIGARYLTIEVPFWIVSAYSIAVRGLGLYLRETRHRLKESRRDSDLDIRPAVEDFGYAPLGFQDGLKECIREIAAS